MSLSTYRAHSGKAPRLCVIWMHGLGATGTDFLPLVPRIWDAVDCVLIFPNAPSRRVSMNGGAVMPAWYDILTDFSADRKGLFQAMDDIRALIDEQIAAGFSPEQIVLLGFSQGGVIAQLTGLTDERQFGGILGMSTHLPLDDHVATHLGPTARSPIEIHHGTTDAMIPVARARASYERVRELAPDAQWREYNMGHSICPEQITRITEWLKERAAS